jgi:hypothetical protein
MPSRMKTAQNLEDRYLANAPKKNHEKISIVLEIYRGNKKVKTHIAEMVLMALYSPRSFGPVGNKRGKPDKADDIYDEFVSKYEKSSAENTENQEGQRRHKTENHEELRAEGRALHTGEEDGPK